MKLDKDALMKHHFWLLLIAPVLLFLVSFFLLTSVIPAGTNAELQKIIGEIKKLDGVKNPPSVGEIELVQEAYDITHKLETVAWREAFATQNTLFTWADAFEARHHFSDGEFVNEVTFAKTPEGEQMPKEDTEPFVMNGFLVDVVGPTLTFKDLAGKSRTMYATLDFTFTDKLGEAEKTNQKLNVLTENKDAYRGKYVTVKYQKTRYFNELLREDERQDFQRSYKDQLPPLLEMVNPVDENGKGVVQFKGWTWRKGELPPVPNKFLNYIPQNWKANIDFSKEAWIAQENIWIQREMFRIIREANDSIAVFKGTGGTEKKHNYSFENPYFQLDLEWDGADKLTVNTTNKTSRRQKLDVTFLVKMSKTLGPERIKIGGEPLAPAGSQDAKNRDSRRDVIELAKGVSRDGIYSVEQELNWETAAIKRIDAISIGSQSSTEGLSHSHRTFPEGLQPLEKKAEDAAAAAQPAGVPPMGDMGPMGAGAPPPVFAGGGFGQGGMSGQGGNKELLDHGFWSDRYVQVTPQFRRIPVGVAVIIDQEHIDRVQRAFSNSKLRYLVTQVLINHYPGSMQPIVQGPANPGGAGFPGVPPGIIGAEGPMGPMGPGGPPPAFFAPGAGGAQGLEGTVDQGLEANLEFVVYGFVTIYNRYPERPFTPPAAAAKN